MIADVLDPLSIYRLYSSQMQSCDLVECASPGAIGGSIRFVTGKRVNHSAILLRLDQYEGMKDRRYLIEAGNKGLELTILSEWLEKYQGEVWWSRIKCTEEQRARMATWAMDEMARKKGYDFGGLFKNVFGRVSLNGRRWFCSEAYHKMIIVGGVVAEEEKARRPGEFAELGVHDAPVQIRFQTLSELVGVEQKA